MNVIDMIQTLGFLSYVSLVRLKNKLTRKSRSKYMSEDEIVNDMCIGLTKHDKQALRDCECEHELIQFHHTAGRHIRNKYKLWFNDNPLTNWEKEDDERHPDNVSQRIIKKVWKRVNKKET